MKITKALISCAGPDRTGHRKADTCGSSAAPDGPRTSRRILCSVFSACMEIVEDLAEDTKVKHAVRALAARMPTSITLKDMKKRWGSGQEDVFPVTPFEKLWGDMTALPELDCRFASVPRLSGQQLKAPARLDGWLRDGPAAYVESLCE